MRVPVIWRPIVEGLRPILGPNPKSNLAICELEYIVHLTSYPEDFDYILKVTFPTIEFLVLIKVAVQSQAQLYH